MKENYQNSISIFFKRAFLLMNSNYKSTSHLIWMKILVFPEKFKHIFCRVFA